MVRGIWVWDSDLGKNVPKAEYLASQRPKPHPNGLKTPMLIGDTMEGVQSQLDGKMYDSKSALRQTYKEAGVTEVGNDSSVMNPQFYEPPRPDGGAISEAVDKAYSKVELTAGPGETDNT